MRDDFSSISPTARSLLFMKARAGIPYARKAAEVIWGDGLDPALEKASDLRFLLLLAHFENRYRTVDELARESGISSYLELSSGYSFRGLDFTRAPGVRYLDTDLPDLVAAKRILMKSMSEAGLVSPSENRPELESLNALDAKKFGELAEGFGHSALCILNEGLLVYLDEEEKRLLCANVRNALLRHGGCWISGDVYVRTRDGRASLLTLDEAAARFHAIHRTEENKFEDFEAAEAFFRSCGLKVTDRRARSVGALNATEILKDFVHRKESSAGDRQAEPDVPGFQDLSGFRKNHETSRETWRLEAA